MLINLLKLETTLHKTSIGKINLSHPDEKDRIPANDSISMNLSGVYTLTEIEFSDKLKSHQVILNNKKLASDKALRVVSQLDRVRELAGIKHRAKVVTKNNFPMGAEIASSASGFAALSLAASKAAGLTLSQKQLSNLSRLGSGSACRSIPDGFTWWKKGTSSDNSYAVSLFPHTY